MKKTILTPFILVLIAAICTTFFLSWKSVPKAQNFAVNAKTIIASPPQEITFSNAKKFFKNHRKDRKFVDTDFGGREKDSNKKEGYFDLTSDQIQQLSDIMQTKGFAKARIYFGSNGGNSYLIINGFDSEGNEIVPADPSTETLSSIPIGSSTDCPKHCDVTSTALYVAPN